MNKIFTKDLFLSLFLLIGIFFLKTALTPIFIGVILAYLCGPLAKTLHHFLPRALSSLIALLLIVICLFSLFWHLIASQDFLTFKLKINQLMTSDFALGFAPYLASLQAFIMTKFNENIEDILTTILSSTQSFLTIATNLFLAPFLAFYFLDEVYFTQKKIPGLIGRIISYLDLLLQNFCQIQITFALIYGLYAMLLLSLLKVDNPVTLGLFYGLSYLIPYLGFMISTSLIMLLTFLQYGLDYQILILLLGFLGLTFLDSWVINPKFIAPKFGLSPLSSLIAVLVTGKIFGLIGMIFAIPVGVIVQDTIKFLWSWNGSLERHKIKKKTKSEE